MKLHVEIELDNDAMRDCAEIKRVLIDVAKRLNLHIPGPYNLHDINGNWVGKAWFEEER